ncbi:uncharacterized protein LOC142177101 [Nicotiana tabacum]|uniref:Uncharacterized protein LOC142177101 n=1 Tax=Nicotiana tabacum TaxID=4097 RepID=A0AC58TWQ3_TOBAC
MSRSCCKVPQETWQQGPVAKFLKKHGICAQYTMPGIPQQIGIAEKHNPTLMDMLLNMVPSKVVPNTPFELWMGRKPNLRHLHVWGCPAEARVYNPQENKLDSRTVSGYLIGYPEKSKKYMFYCPNNSSRIVEIVNARFFDNGEISGSVKKQSVEIKEVRVNILLPTNVPTSTQIPNIVHFIEEHFENAEQHLDEMLHEETNSQISEPQEITLRKSQRARKLAISDDYVVYFQESNFDTGLKKDPLLFSYAIESNESKKWIDAMKEKLKSME